MIRWTSVVIGACLLACIGLVEWLGWSVGSLPAATDLLRGAAWSLGLYGAVGAVVGAVWSGVGKDAGRRTVATVVGCFVFLRTGVSGWFDDLATGNLSFTLTAAVGFAAGVTTFWVGGRLRFLTAARVWSSALALLLACYLVISASDTGRVAAWGAVIGTLVLSVDSARRRTSKWRWSALGAVSLGAAALMYLSARPTVMPAVEPSGRGTSILLITIDTLRADRIGAYGYNKARTPNLDTLARGGLLFQNAFAHSNLTGPSHLTILSGMTSLDHGLIENGHRAPENVPTLADWLQAEGWDTAAFVSGFPLTDGALRIGSRFRRFDDELRLFDWIPKTMSRRAALPYLVDSRVNRFLGQTPGEPAYRPAELVTDAASEWLGTRGAGPFFLWVHYFDPHSPYRPPRRFWNDQMRNFSGPGADGRWYTLNQKEQERILAEPAGLRHMSDLYDSEVAYVDAQLGRLLETAQSMPAGDNLLIVVTADHGTEFGEHGGWIRRDLYDTTLHVPLIVVPPESTRWGPAVVEEQVGLADVAATILELAGATVRTGPTRSLSRRPSPNNVIAVQPQQGNDEISYMIREGGRKLIHRPLFGKGGEAAQELYDLMSDPVELENLIEKRPGEASELFERLEPRMTFVALEQPELTPQQIKELRSLGYIQ